MRGFFGFCIMFFSVCVLSVSMFAPVSLSSQLPIDTTTFYEGTLGWGPGRADPQRVYDTGSGQLVFNSYEGLITWNRESYYTFNPLLATNVPDRGETTIAISNTSAVNDDVYDVTWSDGSISKGYCDMNGPVLGFSVGDVLYLDTAGTYRAWFVESMVGTYAVTLRRYWYTFNIRTSPVINFFDTSGLTVDTFDIDDAVYTFKRGLCQDTGPQWMFYTSMFGTYNSASWVPNASAPIDATRKNSMDLAHLIDSAVEKSGNDLTMNLGVPFPDNAFKQCLSNTWGCITSKSFCMSIGCWNDDLYTSNTLGHPAWVNSSLVWHKSRSPLDQTGSLKWVGTGPYHVATFNQTGYKVVLQRNSGWWQGWPIPGNGNPYSTGYVDTYEIDYIADWTERKHRFLAGTLDSCQVPKSNMFELLQAPNTNAEPILIGGKPVIKTIKNLVPVSLDGVFFTFTLNSTCPYIGSGHFPDGIPLDFFNNTHVRKAFAYSVSRTQYSEYAYYGETTCPFTPLIEGLYPDYRTITSGYDENFTSAEAELKAASFGGQNVWDTGFTLNLVYPTGGMSTRIMVQMIRDFFNTLSTYDGRTGPPFTINLYTLDWSIYLDYFETFKLPLFEISWLADFADADNFVRPYMHSNGDLSSFQNYSLTNGWGSTHGSNYPTLNKDGLIEKAFATPDGSDRAKMYADLESIYMADCPSLPMPIPTGRKWWQYWVKGWYFNALYPATYIPSVYKYDDCWFDVNGPTMGVSDGIVNMRDIQYLILRFNAKASIPGTTPDPKWVGTYGNGGVDPYGDRTCNMRDIQGAILHFSHQNNTLTP